MDDLIKQIIFSNRISCATEYNINNCSQLYNGLVFQTIINVNDYLPSTLQNPFTASMNRVYLLNDNNIETYIKYRDNPTSTKFS